MFVVSVFLLFSLFSITFLCICFCNCLSQSLLSPLCFCLVSFEVFLCLHLSNQSVLFSIVSVCQLISVCFSLSLSRSHSLCNQFSPLFKPLSPVTVKTSNSTHHCTSVSTCFCFGQFFFCSTLIATSSNQQHGHCTSRYSLKSLESNCCTCLRQFRVQ